MNTLFLALLYIFSGCCLVYCLDKKHPYLIDDFEEGFLLILFWPLLLLTILTAFFVSIWDRR